MEDRTEFFPVPWHLDGLTLCSADNVPRAKAFSPDTALFIIEAINHYAAALYEESLNVPDENTVTPSCGCVFCDLGLKPTNGWHQTVDLEPIRCPLA